LFKTLDPEISRDKLYLLERRIPHTDTFTADSFIRTCLDYGVKRYGLGVFHIDEIDRALGERKMESGEL
jgi:hypothetical protein